MDFQTTRMIKVDRMIIGGRDSQQGLEPSQGRFVMTHWSQACLEVVARVADVEPLRLLFGGIVDFCEE